MAGLQDKLASRLQAYQKIVGVFREALSEKEMAGLDDAIKRMQSLTVAIAVFGRTRAGSRQY